MSVHLFADVLRVPTDYVIRCGQSEEAVQPNNSLQKDGAPHPRGWRVKMHTGPTTCICSKTLVVVVVSAGSGHPAPISVLLRWCFAGPINTNSNACDVIASLQAGTPSCMQIHSSRRTSLKNALTWKCGELHARSTTGTVRSLRCSTRSTLNWTSQLPVKRLHSILQRSQKLPAMHESQKCCTTRKMSAFGFLWQNSQASFIAKIINLH